MVTVNWGTKLISVPQSDLVMVSGTTYTHDTDVFRLDVIDLQDDVLGGMVYLDALEHTKEKTIAGITYARFVEIINGYTVEYEDGMYAVILEGSNNNIFAEGIIVRNQVSIIPTNAAGLIVAPDNSQAIAAAVWAELAANEIGAGTRGLEATETNQSSDQAATQRYT